MGSRGTVVFTGGFLGWFTRRRPYAGELSKPLAAGQIAVRIDGQTKSVSLSWANLGRVGASGAPR